MKTNLPPQLKGNEFGINENFNVKLDLGLSLKEANGRLNAFQLPSYPSCRIFQMQ